MTSRELAERMRKDTPEPFDMKLNLTLSLFLAEQLRSQPGRCYRDSFRALERLLQMEVTNVRYVEGFALWQAMGTYEATAHAWLLVDGEIVDVTRPAAYYFPATVYTVDDVRGQQHFPLFRDDRRAQHHLDAARAQAQARMRQLCPQPMAIWMADESSPTSETVLKTE